MRASKASSTARRNLQPRNSSPSKKRSPKTPTNMPKYTHFFFILKSAKQLHQLTSKFLSATVRVHPNLNPMSSIPVLCHHSQAEFNFAFAMDLSGSNVADSPELFSPKITISTSDPDHHESVASATVLQTKAKISHINGRSLMYLANHQDLPLKLLSSPKIGGYINVTCAFGSLEHQHVIEPSLDFIETSVKLLQRSTPEKYSDAWKSDAAENGWVPPEKAAEIWQKIALEHGWKAPEKPKMEITFSTIEDSSPTITDNTDLISFSSEEQDLKGDDYLEEEDLNQSNEKFEDNVEQFVNFALASKYSIQSESVFDQQPKTHDRSNRFTIFEMEPQWQPTDSDADLNRDLTRLLAESKRQRPQRKLRSITPDKK
ncbi:hypothetical protein TRFO_31912 [Tritrichomonas foetus]|uniref:Uncharacterized protein n=1 Tax=Tritrichomonas foetus TaxID=1144522 RepID=A0A1J4JUT7_9EUKA|nr:hypothetical protein TRFO_31912 [Tritrichomonas foetus]|eukprot:OHT01286.1 hypothetical protein TRFO_31912 [Tritrichomonas foetus]